MLCVRSLLFPTSDHLAVTPANDHFMGTACVVLALPLPILHRLCHVTLSLTFLDSGAMQLFHKRLKKIESWPNKILAWANWRRFNIPMDRYEEYIPCYSAPAVHWSFLPVT
jgi:hypothetical protein